MSAEGDEKGGGVELRKRRWSERSGAAGAHEGGGGLRSGCGDAKPALQKHLKTTTREVHITPARLLHRDKLIQ